MVFEATAVRVIIASPSDVQSARDASVEVIHEWNASNAHHRKKVLIPWRWETSSVPLLGSPAQSIINKQGLDEADVVIALFGTRLGTPTADALSGTVEELRRAESLGKPVHVYFSREAIHLDSIDPVELATLRDFKNSLVGLYSEFSTLTELEANIRRAVEHDLAGFESPQLQTTTPIVTPPAEVRWSLDHEQERELKGYSPRGKPQYTTRHTLAVTNRGDLTAKHVTFHAFPENSSLIIFSASNPTDIYSGQTKRLSAMFTMGGEDPQLRIEWIEDGKPKSVELFVN